MPSPSVPRGLVSGSTYRTANASPDRPSNNPLTPAPPAIPERNTQSGNVPVPGGSAQQQALYVRHLVQQNAATIGKLFPDSKDGEIPLFQFLGELLRRSSGTYLTLTGAVTFLREMQGPVTARKQPSSNPSGGASTESGLNPDPGIPNGRKLIVAALALAHPNKQLTNDQWAKMTGMQSGQIASVKAFAEKMLLENREHTIAKTLAEFFPDAKEGTPELDGFVKELVRKSGATYPSLTNTLDLLHKVQGEAVDISGREMFIGALMSTVSHTQGDAVWTDATGIAPERIAFIEKYVAERKRERENFFSTITNRIKEIFPNVIDNQGDNQRIPLPQFVEKIIRKSRSEENHIICALHYLKKIGDAVRNNQDEQPDRSMDRVKFRFVAALMLARKFLDDKFYKNSAWSEICGVGVQDINTHEKTVLKMLHYNVFISSKEFNEQREDFLNSWKKVGSIKHSVTAQSQNKRGAIEAFGSPQEDLQNKRSKPAAV